MADLTRRQVLAGAAAALALARLELLTGLPAASAAPLPLDPFTLGVASGDPQPDGVVLWTRLAPDPTHGGGMPPDDVAVGWEVATDAAFTDVVASGTEPAVAALAHSVHAEVGGLAADRWYHYRFTAGGWTSPVGRARTTPLPAARTPLRFGAASCQNWRSGYYTAHAHLAAEGCDVVFFLGDYIYENAGSGPVRSHGPTAATDLAGYRNRYGLYKGDPNLQAAHAACPWVLIWDDHEVVNNYAGTNGPNGVDPAAFLARRAAAYQAWYEHQPVRLSPPSGQPDQEVRIFRRLDWGTLARFHLLDTRQYRSDQACGDGLKPACAGWDDSARTLLGDAQEAWLLDGLTGAAAAAHTVWDVLTQQIVFVPMPIESVWNMDQWDGYPAQRGRAWPPLATRPNPVVLSGDIHFGGMAHLHEDLQDATTPRRGTELVVGSISSLFTSLDPSLIKDAVESVPWWEHVNAAERGYVVVDLTETSLHAELRVVSTVAEQTAEVRTDHALDVVAVPVAPPVDPQVTTTTTDPASPTATTPTTTTSDPTTTAPTAVGTAPGATAVTAAPQLTG